MLYIVFCGIIVLYGTIAYVIESLDADKKEEFYNEVLEMRI